MFRHAGGFKKVGAAHMDNNSEWCPFVFVAGFRPVFYKVKSFAQTKGHAFAGSSVEKDAVCPGANRVVEQVRDARMVHSTILEHGRKSRAKDFNITDLHSKIVGITESSQRNKSGNPVNSFQ